MSNKILPICASGSKRFSVDFSFNQVRNQIEDVQSKLSPQMERCVNLKGFCSLSSGKRDECHKFTLIGQILDNLDCLIKESEDLENQIE